jgi:hypothetical protein
MKRLSLLALGALAVTGALAVRAQQPEPPKHRVIVPQLEMQAPSARPEALTPPTAPGAPWTYRPCPYAQSPVYPGLPGVCHPYPQPWPAPSTETTTCSPTASPTTCKTVVDTGAGIFPPSNPFNFLTFPGDNFLPTVYTNVFNSLGQEIPNTLPSTPDVPYNLQAGDPVVSMINPTSPEDDLHTLFDSILHLIDGERDKATGLAALNQKYDQDAVRAALRTANDILEGNPVSERAYSGLPLLHYTGPEKVKEVVAIKNAQGEVTGGNVDVHQVWFDQRIESDTAFFDLSQLYQTRSKSWDGSWTVTYTVDVLNRGRDDFSPYVMYTDYIGQPGPKPGIGMDQTFFDMEDGTRTVFKIKMAPPEFLNLVYTWGWRMHPPRAQVTENAGKTISYCKTPPCTPAAPPVCPASYQGKTLPELEQAVFCLPDNPNCTHVRCRPGEPETGADGKPAACVKQKLYAISQLGDLAPEKRMWHAVNDARKAAGLGDFKTVEKLVREEAFPAYWNWLNRNQLPKGVPKDPDSDVTLLYVNNSTYGELTNGAWGRWDAWEQRPKKFKVTVYNGDNFVHAYTIADFGGNRGWENQFKSSVKVAGSGCWFTFGRNWWWIPVGGPVNPYVCVPQTQGLTPGVHKLEVELNYEPSRRLRLYQFDPFHHDVAIYSIH